MKRLICIEILEEHKNATYYAVRFADEEETEFDKFFNQFIGHPLYRADMVLIANWMQKIGEEGIIDDHLKPEGTIYTKALPIEYSHLRLYCFKIKNIILLFAGGGRKRTRTYQEDPILHQHVLCVRKAGNKILRYIELGKIIIQDNKLEGKLKFEIDL